MHSIKAQLSKSVQLPIVKLSSLALMVMLTAGAAFVLQRYYRITGQDANFDYVFEITRAAVNFGGMALLTPFIFQGVKWSLKFPRARVIFWLSGLLFFAFCYILLNKLFLFAFQEETFQGFLKYSRKLFLNFSHVLALFYTAASYASYQIITKRESKENTPLKSDSTDYLILKVDGLERKFRFDNIRRIETYDHYLKLHDHLDQVHLTRKSLKQILPLLPENFLRIHRSHVVNQKYVKKVISKKGQYHLNMKEGMSLKVSDSFKKNVNHLIHLP